MQAVGSHTGGVWVDLGRKAITADNLKHEDVTLSRLSVTLDGADVDRFEKSLAPERLLGGGKPDLESLAKAEVQLQNCEISVGPKTQGRLREMLKPGLAGLPPFVASAILGSLAGDQGLSLQLSAEKAESKEIPTHFQFSNDRLEAGGFQVQDFTLEEMKLQLPGAGQRIGSILQALNFESKPTAETVDPLKDQPVGLEALQFRVGPQVQGAVKAALTESLKGSVPGLETLLDSTLNGEEMRLRLAVQQGGAPEQARMSLPPQFERGVHVNLADGSLQMKNLQTGSLGIDRLQVNAPSSPQLLEQTFSLEKLFSGEKPALDSVDRLLPLDADDFKVRIGSETLDGLQENLLKSEELKSLKVKPGENGRFTFSGEAKKFLTFNFSGAGQLGTTEDGRLEVKLAELEAEGYPSFLTNGLRGFLLKILTPDEEGVEVEDSTIRLNLASVLPPGINIRVTEATTENGEFVFSNQKPQP